MEVLLICSSGARYQDTFLKSVKLQSLILDFLQLELNRHIEDMSLVFNQ